ncbi:MAG: FapA family protein [Bacillota bacterium]
MSEELRDILKEVLSLQRGPTGHRAPQGVPVPDFQPIGNEADKIAGDDGISGYAAVESGAIIIYGDSQDSIAEISVPDNMVLLVNGKPHTGLVRVRRKDRLEAALPPLRITNGCVKVTKSDDEMEAFLEIAPDMATRYRLVDKQKQKRLHLNMKEETDLFCSIDYDDVIAILNDEGIVYGIDYPQITRLTQKCCHGVYRVALGLPPGEPVDESVKIFFPQPDKNENAAGDYDAKSPDKNLFSVDKGAVLAVKEYGQPGQPGICVTGRQIDPKPPRQVEIVAGRNTEMSPDGTTIRAKVDGRPFVVRKDSTYKFTVSPLLIYSSDVSVATGCIYFRGDIQVCGNVLDGAVVYASGNVEISGSVSFARVNCGGKLFIDNNVFSSTIQAGSPATYFMRQAKGLLTNIISGLNNLADYAAVVLNHPVVQERRAPLRLLLLNIIELKLPQLRTQIKQLCDLIKKNEFSLPKSTGALVQELEKFQPGLTIPEMQDAEPLRSLAMDLKFLQDCAAVSPAGYSRVVIPYALNSFIESTGSVQVYGRGCYNTVINADGNVGVNGTFRGGRIESRGNVRIQEAGSKLCILTKIIIPSAKTVTIGFCHPGVVVCSGSHIIRFEYAYRNVQILTDENHKPRVFGKKLDENSHSVLKDTQVNVQLDVPSGASRA